MGMQAQFELGKVDTVNKLSFLTCAISPRNYLMLFAALFYMHTLKICALVFGDILV